LKGDDSSRRAESELGEVLLAQRVRELVDDKCLHLDRKRVVWSSIKGNVGEVKIWLIEGCDEDPCRIRSTSVLSR